MSLTPTLTALAVAASAAGLGAAVVVRRRRGSDLWVVVAALAAAGAVTSLVALVLRGRLDLFGRAHLVYLAAVVTLPVIGAGLLIVPTLRPRRPAALAVAVLLLVPAVVGYYGTHIEPFRLRTQHVTVGLSRARAGRMPITVAVIADYQPAHIGRYERDAITKVLAMHADLIVLPGDLFQGDDAQFARQLPALRAQLARLHAPAGVFYVRGDNDPDRRVDAMLQGTDLQVLDDRIVTLRVRDRTVLLGGTRLAWWSPAAQRVRDQLATAPDRGEVRILMSHRPDTVLPLPARSRVDLTVAGHTHGGQVVVPGYGPLQTLSSVPRDVARGGLHEVSGNRIEVSPGVGLERGQAPQVRVFDRPAVVLVTLRAAGP